jgi:CheY-like chemotaxis protein/HPt (histidine-containing phosphotransfer) domain-containing protein
MLTSEDRAGDMARGQSLGINAYLVKPIQRSELSKAIQSAMNRASTKAEMQTVQEDSYRAADQLWLRLLLADDSEDNVFLIQSYLKHSENSIDVAENGEVAVQKFRSGSYDLVLMDLQMPVMDGYVATQRIREWEQEHHAKPVPILALSAYALQSEIEKSRDAGCTAYLTKPIRRKTLLETIEKYSEARRNRPGQEKLSEKTQASVDERLRSIIPAYLQGRRKDILTVLTALDSSDYERIRTVAHKMRGSGAGYGFPEITAIGQRLELAAENRDEESARKHAAELSEHLDALESAVLRTY